MSKVFGSVVSKLIIIIAIVVFIGACKNLIITDPAVSDAFDEMMEELPFAKLTTDVIVGLMKCDSGGIPKFTAASFTEDMLKLAVMACIQPIVFRLLSLLFLKVPAGSCSERESFMSGWSYRLKETLIIILTAPLIAFLSAHLITRASNYLTAHLGELAALLIGIGALIGIAGLSLIPLVIGKIAFGTAVAWRLGVTFLGKMATIVITDAICLWLYLAIVTGAHSQIFICIVSYILLLLAAEAGLNWLKRKIAFTNLP